MLLQFIILAVLFQSESINTLEDYGNVVGQWSVSYVDYSASRPLKLGSRSNQSVIMSIFNVEKPDEIVARELYFQINVGNEKLIYASQIIEVSEFMQSPAAEQYSEWSGTLLVTGKHFGYTEIYVTLHNRQQTMYERSRESLPVTVFRQDNVLNENIYTYTAMGLMLLMFINLGTVMDLQRLKNILFKPVGPFIGFCARFAIMPALALGLGKLCFAERKDLQLGLFYTGLAPSGGIANIAVVFVKGNLNLSIATTSVNSLLALAMLPFWILVVASKVIYTQDDELAVPYMQLTLAAVVLVVALILGLSLRSCIPKTTRFVFKFLKPLLVLLSLVLIGVAVGLNNFVFSELNLYIILAGFFLPLVGYLLTYIFSKLFCRTSTDAMTIGIESCVLSMTLPILLLQYSLKEPDADMATAVPIISSLFSLALFVVFYIVRKLLGWNKKTSDDAFDEHDILDEVK